MSDNLYSIYFGVNEKDKTRMIKSAHNTKDMIAYDLIKTNNMFRWKGLPDTIPQRNLELNLQSSGLQAFIKHNNNYYVVNANQFGTKDPYYEGELVTVTNPALNYSDTLTIGKECEIIRNDALCVGLLPILSKWSNLQSINEVSLIVAMYNTRIISLMCATDSKAKVALDTYIQKIIDGELSAIFQDQSLLDSIKTQPYASTGMSNIIQELIELEQYFWARKNIDLGINSNWNAKREALSSDETNLNNDVLSTLVDNMLLERQQACERINTLFPDLHISVEFSGIWHENQREKEANLQTLEHLQNSEDFKEDSEEDFKDDSEEDFKDDSEEDSRKREDK